MDELTALLASLDGGSVVIGAVIGLLCGAVIARLARPNVRKALTDLSVELQSSLDNVSSETLQKSTEELSKSNESLLTRLEDKSRFQSEQQSTELESKKALIDQQLEQMSDTLKIVPNELEKNQNKVNKVLQLSTEQLKESNQNYLNQLAEKSETQTKEHIRELEAKKKLIDQHLEQMSKTLETVPTELEKNQNKVAEVLDKSAESLKESNQNYLNQLAEKSETQTKEHNAKLDEKELLISRRLTQMDDKLGEVQKLIDEFEKARESKLGALDDQLKNLTQTTSELHRALADNRARGQWGERIAEDLLKLMGFVEGINFYKQMTLPSGERPDFTISLPTGIYVHMDVKYSFDNYDMYHKADNNHDRAKYADAFGRNVKNVIRDVANKGYINEETVDCVVLLIPNEPVYRFMHEKDHSMMDFAMKNRVVLCSPMNLYPVLAVIHQAAQSLAFEQRSQEVFTVLTEIRNEWAKYTEQMDGMEKNFSTLERKFRELSGARTRQLDKKFDKIDTILDGNESDSGVEIQLPELPG